MKKTIAFLLLAALLSAAAACNSQKSDPAATTAAATSDSSDSTEIPGDTILSTEGYNIDFTQYLNIPSLSTVKASLSEVEDAWTDAANEIRYENITLTDTAESYTAELNDQVNIHYKGYAASSDVVISEATLQNMTNFDYDDDGHLEEGFDLILGSGSFIRAYESETNPEKNNPGFEEQLVGAKAGETRTITVTFPDNYGSDELNGTVIKFDVTINSIKKGSLPELTDEMVSEYTGGEYATVDAYKDYIVEYHKKNLAFQAIFNAITVEAYPDEEMDREISEYIANYIQSVYKDEELTEEETKQIFDEQYDTAYAYAEQIVSERLVLEYLFKEFSVTLTQDEYIQMRDEDFSRYAFYYIYYYGISDVTQLEETFGKDTLIVSFKYDKLLPLLIDQVVFE